MRVIIAHYHLNPGGVTRVIENQIKALQELHKEKIYINLLTGSVPEDSNLNVDITLLPEINYLNRDNKGEYNSLYERIYSTLKSIIHYGDIIHLHNINLGKNPVFSAVIYTLAKKGHIIFNHVHDFIEDRPDNLKFMKEVLENIFEENLQNVLYPAYDKYHFGVLTSFDKARIEKNRINKEKIWLIPNPVHILDYKPTGEEREILINKLNLNPSLPIFVYPVRVIRRKNIGELILLATLFKDKANWIVTLPPKNPIEIPEYEEWKRFSKSLNLNIRFEAGTILDFNTIMAGCEKVITTSIKEGFGMAFVEPWIYNKPVVGRDLPEVTQDFINMGLIFPCLYKSITIPLPGGEEKDFSELPKELKMEIIIKASKDLEFSKTIINANDLQHILFSDVDTNIIYQNKCIIKQYLSIHRYGERLYEIYKTIS